MFPVRKSFKAIAWARARLFVCDLDSGPGIGKYSTSDPYGQYWSSQHGLQTTPGSVLSLRFGERFGISSPCLAVAVCCVF